MQNLRVLRQRIRSVQNTQKITRAMQLVAGAKLRRSQEELLSFRPYAERMEKITQRFLKDHPEMEHPLLSPNPKGSDPKEGAPVGLIVISSDTGLCGTYNERVVGMAKQFLLESPSALLVTVGKKGNRVFARRGVRRVKEVLDWGGRYEPSRVASFLDWLLDLYLKGKVSAWHVAYTQFRSALSWKPMVDSFLPAERPPSTHWPEGRGAASSNLLSGKAPSRGASSRRSHWPERTIAEPDPNRFADRLLHEFVRTQWRRILLEAFTSEHSARMVAMKNATDNAEEMIEHLTLVRNKVRQAAITKELIEVVSGAEALK